MTSYILEVQWSQHQDYLFGLTRVFGRSKYTLRLRGYIVGIDQISIAIFDSRGYRVRVLGLDPRSHN